MASKPHLPPFAWKLCFEVTRDLHGERTAPLHPAQARLFVAAGRYNMALVDSDGAPMRVFVPYDSAVESIMAALNAATPGADRWPWRIADLMNYAPSPADTAEA